MLSLRRLWFAPTVVCSIFLTSAAVAALPQKSDPSPRSERRPIEGYADQLSCRAGDEVALHISTVAEKYTLEITRQGAEPVVVWKKEGLPGKEYAVPANAS